MIFRGKTWKFGDNIDTDQIIPAEYLVTSDKKELAKHIFEKVRPEFSKKVRKGDIIVAGRNFGCGSSREHAPRAVLGAGISAVIAKSFARIFFRNAINIGLPVVICENTDVIKEGDSIVVDTEKGTIYLPEKEITVNFEPLSDFAEELIREGGLIEKLKKELQSSL